MIMNNPTLAEYLRWLDRDTEQKRLELERQKNVVRLIAYNNRRLCIGLHPLEIPVALLRRHKRITPSWRPKHRDNINLNWRQQ